MNEFVEIRIINTSDSGIGLKDTQERLYNIPLNGQLRLSLENFKSILDEPISKRMICKGMAKIEGITEEMLIGSILSDEERDYILGDRDVAVEEDCGTHTIEIEEEKAEIAIVKPITFYNWIKNDNKSKLEEAIKNPVNYDTLTDIAAKNPKYNTDLVQEILSK